MDFFLALFCFISFCMNGVNDRGHMMTVVSNTRDVITFHTDDTETERDHVLWMVGARNIRSPDGYEWIISKYDNYKGLKNIKDHTRHHTVWSFSDSGCKEKPQRQSSRTRASCDQNIEVENILVMEGDAVTFHTDVAELQENYKIVWWEKGTVIAQATKKSRTIVDERREPRLDISETGSLTIRNMTTTDSGHYLCSIYRGQEAEDKWFGVIVYAPLPIPVITRNSSSSSSNCSVLCSVMNVTHDVSLSWYKGISLLSSISVSDLNIRLSLPLEVEYQDTNTYRCVINNPITNQTQHLNITQLCQPHSAEQVAGFSKTAGIRNPLPAIISAAITGALLILIALAVVKHCRRSRHERQHNI